MGQAALVGHAAVEAAAQLAFPGSHSSREQTLPTCCDPPASRRTPGSGDAPRPGNSVLALDVVARIAARVVVVGAAELRVPCIRPCHEQSPFR